MCLCHVRQDAATQPWLQNLPGTVQRERQCGFLSRHCLEKGCHSKRQNPVDNHPRHTSSAAHRPKSEQLRSIRQRQILAFGGVGPCPNYWCTDIGDQVYTVPVKEVKWSEEYVRIQAQILEHEQAATKKRDGKRKAKNGDSSGGELDLPEAPQDEKTKKAVSTAGQKQKMLASNTALANCAAKSLGPLQNSITGLSKNVDKVQKAGITMPDEVQQTLSEVMTKRLETWAAASRNTVNSHESTRELWKQEDAELPALAKLPFQTGDLKAGLKQAAEVADTLKKLLPAKEPKAKAKEKSVPKPAEGDSQADGAENKPKRRRVKGA